MAGSYTALAAFQLKGKTLHSACKIPAFADERKFHAAYTEKLSPTNRDYLRSIKFILIDEIGMMGKKIALFMDHRMRQADTMRKHLPFAGRSVLWAGDYSQLLPIGKVFCSLERQKIMY